jgi:hypothetical protein
MALMKVQCTLLDALGLGDHETCGAERGLSASNIFLTTLSLDSRRAEGLALSIQARMANPSTDVPTGTMADSAEQRIQVPRRSVSFVLLHPPSCGLPEAPWQLPELHELCAWLKRPSLLADLASASSFSSESSSVPAASGGTSVTTRSRQGRRLACK